MIIVERENGINKLEIQLETTSHLYKPMKYREHASKYFVGASLSGLLIEAIPPQAVKHSQ